MQFILVLAFAIKISLAFRCDDSERDLVGKVVVVTGAAKGIGYAIADNMLQQGVKYLFILDIDVENGTRAADTFNYIYGPGKAVFIKCDVTTDLERVTDCILKRQRRIDVLVCNAGMANEYEPRKMITTNTISMIEWILKFSEIMGKDKCGHGGTIFVVASITGYMIDPFLYSYKASKSAMILFTKSFGHWYNYNKSCVRTVCVNPGFTNTTLVREMTVRDEQIEDFNKLRRDMSYQQPNSVGLAVIDIFKNAESGTAWDVEGGKPPTESAVSYEMPKKYLEDLIRG